MVFHIHNLIFHLVLVSGSVFCSSMNLILLYISTIMSFNKTFPIWTKGDNSVMQGSGYADNVSLRNDGKSELRGDVYLTNSGKLIIGKDKNSTTNYDIDCQNNVNINGNLNVKNVKYTGDFILGNLLGTNSMTSLTIGSQSPYQEYVLNNAGGLAIVNIWARRLGVVNIGSANLNNNMNVFLNGGQSTIQIGNGVSNGSSGVIYLGSQTTNYTNTVNICTSSSIENTLNLGSSVSNVNIQGQMVCNTYVPSTTITTFENTNFITKIYADTIYQTINGLNDYSYLTSASASNLYQPITNMTLYQLVSGMSNYLTTATASTTYQPITNMTLYQLVSGMSNYLTTATASTTYQPITNMALYQLVSGMTNYLTTATASTTYQPITNMTLYQLVSGMSNYLTSATASSTYQPITNMALYQLVSGMTNYLTNATALTTYGKLTDLTTAQTNITNIQSQLTSIPTLTGYNNYTSTGGNNFYYFPYVNTASQIYPSSDNQLCNKRYVDTFYLSQSNAISLYCSKLYGNIITGTNEFDGETVFNNSMNLNANIIANSVTITPTILSYLSGATSNVQTQLDNKPSLNTNNVFTGDNVFQGQYINKLTYLTGSITYTLSSPFYSTYLVDVTTSDINIYLPALSTISKGVEIRFLIPKNANVKTLTINRNISTEFFISYDGIESFVPLSSIVLSNTKTYISIMAYSNTHWYISSPSEIVEIYKNQDIYGTKTFKDNLVLDELLNFNLNCDIITNGVNVTNYEMGYLSGTTSNIQTQFSTLSTTLSNYALNNQPIISSPQFRSTTQNQGGRICGFQSLNGDSRFNMYDENFGGIQPAQIHTQAGYGLGLNAQYGTIKIYQNSITIGEFAAEGLILKNKIKIATASPSIIYATITLTFPLYQYYTITTNSATSVNMPLITTSNVGTQVVFRKINASGSFVTTFLPATGSGQNCYSTLNSTTCTMTTNTYVMKLVAIYFTPTTFAWAQV